MRKRCDAKNSHRDYWIEELYWGLSKSKTIFYDVFLFRKWLGLKRILLSDWPPKMEEWAYLGHSGFPALSSKLVRSRWLIIGLVDFLFSYFLRHY